MSTEYKTIKYTITDTGIAQVTLAMPKTHNSQSFEMLSEFNDALTLASHDTNVKVIVVAGEGPSFSSGHDALSGNLDLGTYRPDGTWGEFDLPGAEGDWALEEEFYFGFCWRWRNIPKPTISAVHGWVIAGGLMLVWPFDIVIAAENAKFMDPTVAFGVNGLEYFAHPWEVGFRKAKEMLFTGDVMTAKEAKELGMVNHVVKNEELTAFTMDMAERIAQRPSMGLKLAKQSVNQAQDAQGFYSSMRAAMGLQQLGHTHAKLVYGGSGVHPEGAKTIRQITKKWKEQHS